MALFSINMKAIWRSSFPKSHEQADQCNNSGETKEVFVLPTRELPGDCPVNTFFMQSDFSAKMLQIVMLFGLR